MTDIDETEQPATDGAPRLLVVHHTVSPAMATTFEAVREGLGIDELAELEVDYRPALSASASDTLDAHAVLVISPVNIGYLAGAVKHYFDQIYYPCLEATKGLRCAAVLHSNLDASGAVRGLEAITTGLEWEPIDEPLIVSGEPDEQLRERIAELASTIGAYAAGLV